MPLSKLFHRKKSTTKSSSFNGTDLSDRKCEEPPDCAHKTIHSHKSILHFFSGCKNNSHVQFKEIKPSKEKKVKNGKITSQSLNTSSLTQLPSNGKESTNSTGSGGSDRSSGGPRRASSYGTFMDSLARERRLTEIAQLDSYMNYLRRTEDEGNMASRLCCAQVLRMSLVRLEQRHQHSQERLNLCHKGPSSSNSSSPSMSSGSANRNQNLQTSKSASPSDDAASSSDDHSEHESVSDPDSEDNCSVNNKLSKLKLTTKSSSTPVWPRDIEIF